MKRLLLILDIDLHVIAAKGEVVKRYYNPCNYFDEIMILSLQNETYPQAIYTLIGDCKLTYAFVGKPSFLKTLGYRDNLITSWLEKGLHHAEKFSPDVIRIYSNGLNGIMGLYLKRKLNLPLICSTHDVEDRCYEQTIKCNPIYTEIGLKVRMMDFVTRHRKQAVLKAVDTNIVVYESVADYVHRMQGKNIQIIYNNVSEDIPVKTSYSLKEKPKILNIGRQTLGIKEPSNIIKAMDHVTAILDIIGEGDCHEMLVNLAKNNNDVRFYPFRPNHELIEAFKEYDLLVYRFLNWEIAKTVIEALLSGIPVIINRKKDFPVKEFENSDFVYLVDDTPQSWANGINELLSDNEKREKLGRTGREYALEFFSPEQMESKHMHVYDNILST